MTKFLKRVYIFLIVFFMYAPIAVMVVQSFNRSKSRGHWGGFTTQWYLSMFGDRSIMAALRNTLSIAFLSSLIATVISVLACLAIVQMKRRTRRAVMGVTNIPMLNADIVTGISMMLLFLSFGLKFGYGSILIAHITFNIPYVILSIMPRLTALDKSYFEAALDLGASPVRAFFRVVLPELMPGVISGMLMAFTMSIDDFIITHFTKGAGVDTLSTKIYTEVRKGIKPEMYALSTLIFVVILILLLLLNGSRSKAGRKKAPGGRSILEIAPAAFLVAGLAVSACSLTACGSAGEEAGAEASESNVVYVYNWGEYIDPDVIELFEEETGIRVVYDEFETNEIMYPRVAAGASRYDLVCPSDYMIQKMIQNQLLQPLDWMLLPNASGYIGEKYMAQARSFDPGNRYSVPYCWGTVGILYNKTLVDPEDDMESWDILWNPRYKDDILMQDSVRDAFMVALIRNGADSNTTDPAELEAALSSLMEEKPLVQAYVIDEVRDKMIAGEAAIGVIYSGEALYTQEENPDLEYVIPREGTNLWIDGWVIPAGAEHVENAHRFLDFLCRPEIALMNFDYIYYSTPNEGAHALIEDEEVRNSPVLFPELSQYDNLQTFTYLGEAMDRYYNDLWIRLKSY
ncbi:extracellular solute-binding protein [Lachnoclostridium sp. Marseille-P6806]|uniref:extracellular solute-binding protein n=1 Tax=Lachnoclostridium sp. Marseille-P6806 TaxID=2364793 RepID=UPI0010301DA0|nr:extracellular solute-binding protein [Lachnoclostridium sp. Marseille-P6806]